jgi:hypothetical protein
MIDAALERALLDATDARRYFALAGALDRVRLSQATGDGDEARCGSHTSRPDEQSLKAGAEPLNTALITTVAIRALNSTARDGIDPDAWSPGGFGGDARLVAAGATAACRRFDVEAERVAVRSGVSRERLQSDRERTEDDP